MPLVKSTFLKALLIELTSVSDAMFACRSTNFEFISAIKKSATVKDGSFCYISFLYRCRGSYICSKFPL